LVGQTVEVLLEDETVDDDIIYKHSVDGAEQSGETYEAKQSQIMCDSTKTSTCVWRGALDQIQCL
jgi:hypothetical protein